MKKNEIEKTAAAIGIVLIFMFSAFTPAVGSKVIQTPITHLLEARQIENTQIPIQSATHINNEAENSAGVQIPQSNGDDSSIINDRNSILFADFVNFLSDKFSFIPNAPLGGRDSATTIVTKYFDGRKGAMALNFDTELYIGGLIHSGLGWNPLIAEPRVRNNLVGWPNLITESETYGIPVSFNICGLEAVFGSTGRGELAEIDILQPWHSDPHWATYTWYSDMPINGGNYKGYGNISGYNWSCDLIYGGNITERAMNSYVPFEISYHNFGHEDLSKITWENMNDTFRYGVMFHKRIGSKITAEAPPWNNNPNTDRYPIYVQNGIFVFNRLESAMSEPYEAIDNLWIIPRANYNAFTATSDLRSSIDSAINNGVVFANHSHPEDGFWTTNREGYQTSLAYAKSKVDSGELWATTLSEIGRYWEAKSDVSTTTQIVSNRTIVNITLTNYNSTTFGIPFLTFNTTMPNNASFAKITVNYPQTQILNSNSSTVRVVNGNVTYTIYLNPSNVTTVEIEGIETPYMVGVDINKPALAIDSTSPINALSYNPITITATTNSTDSIYSTNLIYQCNDNAKDSKIMTYNSSIWETNIGPFNANDTINYYVTVTDNSGRRERSNNKSFIILAGEDNTSPIWRNQGQNQPNLEYGTHIQLYAQARDNTALSYAILSTNETGIWENKTDYGSPMFLGNIFNAWVWSNFTWQNSSIPIGTTVGWKIYYNDSSGNLNVTEVMSFTIQPDSTPPVISIVYPFNRSILQAGTTWTWINITTNENASCRYSTNPDFNYTDGIDFTYGQGTMQHSFNYSNLVNEQTYNLYYLCNDTFGNINSPSVHHQFSVGMTPLWHDTAWQYRKLITINHTKVATNLTNFPVLISLSSDANLTQFAQPDGNDILFTDYYGNKLNHEIENYTTATGRLVVWVNVTQLSSSIDTTICMYYGNPSCGNQQNPTGTWDSNYIAVWHMNEASGNIIDSTEYHNNGTRKGTGEPAYNSSGQIVGCQKWDGINDYISIPDSESLRLYRTDFSIEVWLYQINRDPTYNSAIIGKGQQIGDTKGWWLALEGALEGTAGQMYLMDGGGQSANINVYSADSPVIALNNWDYAALTWQNASTPVPNFYINGSNVGKDTTPYAPEVLNPVVNSPGIATIIGIDPRDTKGYCWDGMLDEIRISNVERNASWINTSYYSETNNLLTIGTQETYLKKPLLFSESPLNGTTDVDVNPMLSVHIIDLKGNPVQWWIQTNTTGNWINLNNGTLPDGNGTVTATTTTMTSYNTIYYWRVLAFDTISHNWTNATYLFTTKSKPNTPPELLTPSPANGSNNIPIGQVKLQITANDPDGNMMNVTFKTNASTETNEIKLIQNYQSSHSMAPHDYLEEMIPQIVKDYSQKGFWDAANSRWIRRLLWTGSDWSGYVAHDWKYAMQCQEGALQYSIIMNTGHLDTPITKEFNYMHSQVNPDGSIIGIGSVGNIPQCYGYALSSFALGYLYFDGKNQTLANQCYNDSVKVYGYVKSHYGTPGFSGEADDFSISLVGFDNAWKAFNHSGNLTLANDVKTIITNYVRTSINAQAVNGSWNGCTGGVQEHEKRSYAVVLAYDATANATYLPAVKKNIDYIINRHMNPTGNGGILCLNESNPPFNYFYECHQLWFMIGAKLLMDRSNGAYDYTEQLIDAWLFMTDYNYVNIDWYVHNYVNHDAFFSYRNMLDTGALQVHNFKGSYEIGTALWGLSLNYNLTQKANATFWVKVPSIPASPDIKTIYMYYGNTGVTYPVNDQGKMDDTFVFADHFYGTTLNTSKWMVRQGDVSVNNGNLILTGTTGTRGLIDSTVSFSASKAIHASLLWGQNRSINSHFLSLRDVTTPSWQNQSGDAIGSTTPLRISFQTAKNGTVTNTTGLSLVTPMSAKIYKLIWEGTKSTLYQTNTELAQHTSNVATTPQGITFFEGNVSGEIVSVDWIFVRKYASPEPTHSTWTTEMTNVTMYTLTITKNGTGSGMVEVNNSGPYYYGAKVKLWANASVGSEFTGWYGDLSGMTTPDTLTIVGNMDVTAKFTLNGPYVLTLTTSGTGDGTIEANLSAPFYYGDTVTIWANASSGSAFTGFTGDLTGTITPQILTMDDNKDVDAEFTLYGVISLHSNWNLISLPFNESIDKINITVSYLGSNYTWQQAVTNGYILNFIYGWKRGPTNQSYEIADTLQPGQGYWLWSYYDNVDLLISSDVGSDDYITALKQKWNIMGQPYNTSLEKNNLIIYYNTNDYTWIEATTNNNEEGEPLLLGFIYRWNSNTQQYILSDQLKPGYGYWMYSYYNITLYRPIT